MKLFFVEIGNYFLQPWKYIKQYLVSSVLTFLVHFAVYYGVSMLILDLCNRWLINRVLFQVLGQNIQLIPKTLITSTTNPLIIPLILYLSWLIASNVSSIITGLFNTRLSLVCEGSGSVPSQPRLPHTRGFEIFEDLSLLAWNIVFTMTLLVLTQYSLLPQSLIGLLYWVVLPFIYGLYNISYAFLPRRISYAQSIRETFRDPQSFTRFLGFSIASGSIPTVLIYLAGQETWNHLTFAILLLMFSLFRPIGVIAGTLFGNRILLKQKISPTKISFGYLSRRIILLLAGILIVQIVTSLAVQLDSKLNLFSCQYRASGSSPLANILSSDQPLIQRLSKVLLSSKQKVVQASLEIYNPSERHIYVEKINFSVTAGDSQIAATQLGGLDLPSKTTQSLKLDIEVFPLSVLSSLKNLVSGDLTSFRINATLYLDTVLITIPWPVTLVSLK
jgi:hypothetical protein